MKKIYALFVLFSFFCMCGAMDIPTFNKGTAPGDWKDDFPLANRCRKHHGFLYTVKGIERYKFYDKEIVTAPNSII
ncbi:MAG: hypothetical protein IKA32_00435, partial [Lentisphaeria bacterium]|nr:hypothetical protein [Lentisphaeria bacterium]